MNYSINIVVNKSVDDLTVRDILELANELLQNKDIWSILNAEIKFKDPIAIINTEGMKQLLMNLEKNKVSDNTDDLDITFD